MNILILNWRDPKNPLAGGAEKLNLEILKPFIDRGDKITWYAQAVKGFPSKEILRGIRIIRFGNAFTHLFFWPFLYWAKKFGKVNFIIDSIHGTGYLSSIVAPKVKKIILICEVAQNIWDEVYAFPVNKIGRLWEKVMFWFYKKNKFWTISKSTKNDLVGFGIPFQNIKVLPMGFDAIVLSSMPAKYKHPTALFVGRLAKMKGVKDAIIAVSELNTNSSRKWSLNIIGRGEEEYEKELKSLASKLGLNEYVHFLGHVNEKSKFEEMAKAWVLLVPSSREGWGMIVPEANYVGTPVIGYNSPGLSESLAKYSKSNIIVEGKVSEIVKELKKLYNPLTLEEKIVPGWSDLHEFVLSDINIIKNNKQHFHDEIVEKQLGIPPDYQYNALHKSNFLQSNWHSNKLTALDYCLDLNEKICVLDLGAGSGNFELIFGKKVKKITAVDYHKEALDFLGSMLSKNKIDNVRLVNSDIRNLNNIYNIGKFDLVVLVDVIEHIELDEAEKMIKYLKKILIQGGKVCVITPNYKSLWIYMEEVLDRLTIVPRFGGHQHLAKYYPDNLKDIFEKNGYIANSIQSFNLFSFAIPFRFLSTILCKLELGSGIKFGNLLLGIFKYE